MQENVNDSLSKQAETQTDQNIVLCMKWGTKYGAEYVNRLYNMVKRHTTVDQKEVLNAVGINCLHLSQTCTAYKVMHSF